MASLPTEDFPLGTLDFPEENKITIVVAGQTGAGKTTLIRNLLGEEHVVELSPKPITADIPTGTIFSANGATIELVDGPGVTTDK